MRGQAAPGRTRCAERNGGDRSDVRAARDRRAANAVEAAAVQVREDPRRVRNSTAPCLFWKDSIQRNRCDALWPKSISVHHSHSRRASC